MKITLDVSAAAQQTAGIGRYALNLTRALLSLGNAQYTLFYNTPPGAHLPADLAAPQQTVPWGNKALRLRWLLSHWFRQPQDRLTGQPQLFHGLDHILPCLQAPSLVTIHDCSFLDFPQYHTRLNRLNMRLAVPQAARQARLVIADSQSTRRDLLGWLNLSPDKVRVIYPGLDHSRFNRQGDPQAEQARLHQRFNLAPGFILFVSTIEPRKNVSGLLDAYARLRQQGTTQPLVLVGKQGWGYPPVAQLVQERGLSRSVIVTGYIDDEDLRALYHQAALCAYPSFYEGFGLPALEAMASGTPLVTTQVSSLPEVVGEAALFVPPGDVCALAAAMQRLLNDPALRAELTEKGAQQAAGFTWERTARATYALYEEVYGAHRH